MSKLLAISEHLDDRITDRQNERIPIVMSVLQYNQSFIDLTDNKASSLVLVNSILLAASSQAAKALPFDLPLAAACAAALAILLCLLVVRVRLPERREPRRGQLTFFTHVADRQSAAHYRYDLLTSSAAELVESLAEQVHSLCQVLDQKIKMLRLAQIITTLSAVVWVASLLGKS